MSSRYPGYGKGSSRSARDDSRLHDKRTERRRSRSRSRSPTRHSASKGYGAREFSSSSRERDRREYDKKSYRRSSDSQEQPEEVPAPPPPPRISKISIDFSKPKAPIKMSLGGPATMKAPAKPTIASVFNSDDDDDEPEEMPAEARMRMRNIGRETPTSAGPNSFGKTKQGFCDAKKVFEKSLKEALESGNKPSIKFPQTIYKIAGP